MFGKSQGWWGLAGYSPWGLKESDITEKLNNNRIMALVKAKSWLELLVFSRLS